MTKEQLVAEVVAILCDCLDMEPDDEINAYCNFGSNETVQVCLAEWLSPLSNRIEALQTALVAQLQATRHAAGLLELRREIEDALDDELPALEREAEALRKKIAAVEAATRKLLRPA